jgi:hypothetical protein
MEPKSIHMTLAHEATCNAPPPSTGEGAGGGDGYTAVPPHPDLLPRWGEGVSDTTP